MAALMLEELPENSTAPRLRRGTVRRVLRYLRPQARGLAFLAAIIVADALLAVGLPLVLLRVIDDGVLAGDLGAVSRLSLLALVVALLSGATQVGVHWLSSKQGQALVFRLRNDAFAHAQSLPLGFYTAQRSGVLVSRLNNDTDRAQEAITHQLRVLVSSLARLAFVVAAIAYLSWPVLVVVVLVPALVLPPARLVGRRVHKVSHRWLRSFADLTTFVTERLNVSGSLLTQLYGSLDRDRQAFSEVNGRNRDLGVQRSKIAALFTASVASASSIAVVVVYLVGGYLVITGSMTLGTLVALAALVVRMFGPLQALSSTPVEMMTAMASFERVFEMLDQPPTGSDQPGVRPLRGRTDTLEFDRVQFGYRPPPSLDGDRAPPASGPPAPVLREVSFKIAPGQRVALVGPSGSGKSTIAALAARLHLVDAGAVRVGGTDVQDVTLSSLRQAVGVLTQDAHLFHDTIRANLRYAAPDADDERLAKVCRAACIWSLIRTLPEGLDTVVGDRGYRLSGGEKQRLALARLLLKEPSIVILDEATAHLDNASEHMVQQALDRCLAGRTSLVIAHRLSTVRHADEILVLVNGQIVERGRHDELLAAGGTYARLHQEQHGTTNPDHCLVSGAQSS